MIINLFQVPYRLWKY